jgi:uncharacterized protein
MHWLPKTAALASAVGACGFAYSAGYEVRAFRLRRVEIPCLPAGRRAIRALHLSDIHLTPTQRKKQDWLRRLAALAPDLIINTGDNLSHADSVPFLLDALGGPVAKSPTRYLLPDAPTKRLQGPPLPWRDLRAAFDAFGWLDLSNRFGQLTVQGTRIAFAGVDDPHMMYDKLSAVAGPADSTADLRLGIAHAPYLRVLDAFTSNGYDAVFAGHTHGGQLRLPGYGALVTNCDLDARRSRGLSRHRAAGRDAWLHVSAGLGTSPYAPYRFCCYPEATLVTLSASPEPVR